MTARLHVIAAGPAMTVQDAGRPGWLSRGLSRGGAADRLALAEGAALLGRAPDPAALEMAGSGGTFEADADLRIALTGAPMRADLDGAPLAWHASHLMRAGQRLRIGAALEGQYGYLHLGGGLDTPRILGSRSAHLAAGLGARIEAGDTLPVGADAGGETGFVLRPRARFARGTLRVLPSAQTAQFTAEMRARFEATEFRVTARGNRQGVQLDHDGAPFAAERQLSLVSQIIVPGDIQMTGTGQPFVLLPECQTTGGYPRIAAVLPQDLPLVAQARPGTALRFRLVSRAEALETLEDLPELTARLRRQRARLLRDPHDIRDLLGYQLVGGVVDAFAPDPPREARDGTPD